MLDESLAKWHFWTTFLGFYTTFFVRHWLGDAGLQGESQDPRGGDDMTTFPESVRLTARGRRRLRGIERSR
ncbi:hypothetical protein [Amycolatopsis sp. NPDC051371]|uniref:hypothetical protein n=1 Tax=Amycolatopsis sp. NPDC051371 TaxID=3155800 RepID=UPI003439C958